MPGVRRPFSKSQNYRHFGVYSVHDDGYRNRNSGLSDIATQIRAKSNMIPNVKHIPLPSIPTDGQFLFETIALFCTLEALGLQYLNLYRTVWWLPQSNVDHAINFYLIDPYLSGFIIIILCRRIIWHLVKKIIEYSSSGFVRNIMLNVCCIVIGCSLVGGLVWCSFYIIQTHPVVKMFYLCYPISIYFILFGVKASPFFELIPLFPNESQSHNDARNKLVHLCCLSAEDVRGEVEKLKTDFNNRMKQVLFNSLLSAYYTGFIPCCFAQNFLQYDVTFVTQHMTFTWLSCFISYTVHMFPPSYCDHLHRTALHLGRWQKIEVKNFHIPYSPWSESNLWHQGALVKHAKELFRAEGLVNAAEPGNATHHRFRMVFGDPSVLFCLLLVLQVAMLVAQMLLMLHSAEWYRTLSVGLLMVANYYTLFKQIRDYVVLKKVYKAEEICQEHQS